MIRAARAARAVALLSYMAVIALCTARGYWPPAAWWTVGAAVVAVVAINLCLPGGPRR